MIGERILGTGVDLVENGRIDAMVKRWGAHFLDRVFSKDEQAYCNIKAVPSRHLAGRFAVKEAVSKAFLTGIGPRFGWLDLEVARDARGPRRIWDTSRRIETRTSSGREQGRHSAMMVRVVLPAAVLVASVFCSGCGTIVVRTGFGLACQRQNPR